MHVSDEQIHQPIAVPIEKFYPHRAPRRLWKILGCLLRKMFSLFVDVKFVIARHAQHVKIGPAIAVYVANRRISAPAAMFQARFLGNILKLSAAHVLIKDALFAAQRILPAEERVPAPAIKAAAAFLLYGVAADIRD